MTLQAKLNSLQVSQIVTEIDMMLNQEATVTISWWGERLVTIKGYEGSVTIDDLARKYLESNIFPENLTATQESELPTLEERLKCYDLWDKVNNLYTKSDAAQKATWIFWLIVWIKEINLSPYACLEIPYVIRSSDSIHFGSGVGRRNACFEFPIKIFEQLFPNEKPIYAYLTHLTQGKFKHLPRSDLKVVTGSFINEKQLEKIKVVGAFEFNNIPHFKDPSDSYGTFMKKETFIQFFPNKKLPYAHTYYQNNHLKIVKWLVTTREVIQKAIEQNTPRSSDKGNV